MNNRFIHKRIAINFDLISFFFYKSFSMIFRTKITQFSGHTHIDSKWIF